jgi:hypothetical protein
LVEPSGRPEGPNLRRLARTALFLAPALTTAPEHGKDQREQTPVVPQRRNHLRAPPLLLPVARRQVRRAAILPVTSRHLEVIEAGGRVGRQALTGCRKGALLLRQ